MRIKYIPSINQKLKNFGVVTGIIIVQLCYTSCKKAVEVGPPSTSPVSSTVFQSNSTAAAVLTGIYEKMIESAGKFSTGTGSLSLLGGLSSDELRSYTNSSPYALFYKNQLSSSNFPTSLWDEVYQQIYAANAAIEGLTNSTGVTIPVKQQLLGEAKFIRAFFYFYLVNLYGDVPLITITDYRINKSAGRTSKDSVYLQIVTDLTEAQTMLSDNYLKADVVNTTTERVRPSKWAATAMLARVYLYKQDWSNAEAQATAVIDNTTLYDTVSITKGVFNKNSKEAIWQLQPVVTGYNTFDGDVFILTSAPSTARPVAMSNQLQAAFEVGDLRYSNWVNKFNIYYYPYKYKVRGATNTTISEYLMVLRLAEQYLIRAEARAQQSKFTEAKADLNVIRKRAGLPATTANDKTSLLTATLKERQVELFTEWGHRWLDLKRTGNIDAVMSVIAPQKGGTWDTNWQWYPIPLTEIQNNTNLSQNYGYN